MIFMENYKWRCDELPNKKLIVTARARLADRIRRPRKCVYLVPGDDQWWILGARVRHDGRWCADAC